MNISKIMVRLKRIEAENKRTKIEMKGIKEEVSKCKNLLKSYCSG